jgi:hypothetical protein
MNLFPELPEELSPRLKWMEAKNIHTMKTKDGKWLAYKSETQHHFTHEEEADAVVGLAKKLKIRIWNEQTPPHMERQPNPRTN